MDSEKERLNMLRQVKDVVYKNDSVEKDKDLSYELLGKKVLELRFIYPNNKEFGDAIERYLVNIKNNSMFPGVQNL